MSLEETRRIRAIFKKAALPTQIRLNSNRRRKLFAAMRLDKKVSGGEIKFVLAKRIGETVWGQKVPEQLIQETLDSISP